MKNQKQKQPAAPKIAPKRRHDPAVTAARKAEHVRKAAKAKADAEARRAANRRHALSAMEEFARNKAVAEENAVNWSLSIDEVRTMSRAELVQRELNGLIRKGNGKFHPAPVRYIMPVLAPQKEEPAEAQQQDWRDKLRQIATK